MVALDTATTTTCHFSYAKYGYEEKYGLFVVQTFPEQLVLTMSYLSHNGFNCLQTTMRNKSSFDIYEFMRFRLKYLDEIRLLLFKWNESVPLRQIALPAHPMTHCFFLLLNGMQKWCAFLQIKGIAMADADVR